MLKRPCAKQVWAAIFVSVLIYNSTAEDGDLLSEQVDRWLETHPILTRATIAVLAAHLANLVSPQYDVISFGFMAVRKVGWRQRSARWTVAKGAIAGGACATSTSVKQPAGAGHFQNH